MQTLSVQNTFQEEIKRSRFITFAAPVSSVENAKEFIKNNSDLTANHNCWAYRVGKDYRFNDDGEPSGTAGKPIYSAIDHQNLTDVVVLVIRWFGGVKLGTGGLCRAYGGVAAKCLNAADKKEIVHAIYASILFPYTMTQQIYHFLNVHKLPKIDEEFQQNGILIQTEVIADQFEFLNQELKNFSAGQLSLKTIK
jgi:uncharacterized YigZ family protein